MLNQLLVLEKMMLRPLRRDEVLLIKKLGYEGWKQLKYVGRRWIAEIVFSSIKTVLGENLLSKKFKAQKVARFVQ